MQIYSTCRKQVTRNISVDQACVRKDACDYHSYRYTTKSRRNATHLIETLEIKWHRRRYLWEKNTRETSQKTTMESVLQCQPLKHNAITVNVDCDFDAWCYNFGVALFL